MMYTSNYDDKDTLFSYLKGTSGSTSTGTLPPTISLSSTVDDASKY